MSRLKGLEQSKLIQRVVVDLAHGHRFLSEQWPWPFSRQALDQVSLQVLRLHLAFNRIAHVRLQRATLHIEEYTNQELKLPQILAQHVVADSHWYICNNGSQLLGTLVPSSLCLRSELGDNIVPQDAKHGKFVLQVHVPVLELPANEVDIVKEGSLLPYVAVEDVLLAQLILDQKLGAAMDVARGYDAENDNFSDRRCL